ncbi:FUSC family protein [Streptomyces sp. NPDC052051]|uniref:FUSC family protein n=1 Tax=Streptomyces sp. NPDC052051 TaxID=3154649 RepID=UPI00344515C6
MSWVRALKEAARSGLRIERKRLDPLLAVRGATGLALVIAASLWLFGPVVAASSAFGAFQAAIATFQRSWRPRPELALVSGTSLAVSTFVGYLTVSRLPLFLVLLAVWTFLAGLFWAAGPTAGLIASSNVAIMLVTVTLPASVAQAAEHAAMMIVGGLVQAALVMLFPVRPWGAHRDALADALAAEADYARRLRDDPVAPFDPLPLMEARDAAALTPRQARRRPAQLHGTRGLAERLRPVLASLADPAVGVPREGRARERVRELLGAAADILEAAAGAIRHGTPLDLPAHAVAALRTPDTEAILTGPVYRTSERLRTLLQDVLETAGATRQEETAVAGGSPPRYRERPNLLRMIPAVLRTLRAELRPGSPAARHAARVAVVAAVGYLLGDVLPFGHGYWAPLAAVMIMRPDFSQTYSRAVGRFCGTLVGVALATGVVRLGPADPVQSGALAVLAAALMYTVRRTGQIAAQACIAAYVVFLLGMAGEQWTQTVPERVLLTLLGGVLAMLAYAVYPAWETPRLRGRLADWLTAQGRYAAAVIGHYAEPVGKNAPDVREAILRARTARAAWHTAVDRARSEPVRHRGLSRAAADGAEEALAETGRVAMLLEAHLPERGAAPVPAAARFADALRSATEQGAKAVRERRRPSWDALREVLQVWDAERAEGDDACGALAHQGAGLVLAALEGLSEALEPDGSRNSGDATAR